MPVGVVEETERQCLACIARWKARTFCNLGAYTRVCRWTGSIGYSKRQ